MNGTESNEASRTKMDRKAHWDSVYSAKAKNEVSWYQESPSLSLDVIKAIAPIKHGRIIDVGGGTSFLVDSLLECLSFERIAVLDISEAALLKTKNRLGDRAQRVEWFAADITEIEDLGTFDVWHDRAVFHFLTEPADRQRYVALLERTVPSGGHAIIATFADDGPTKCSNLDVRRYTAVTLGAELGPEFSLVQGTAEQHRTPWGSLQSFIRAVFQRR